MINARRRQSEEFYKFNRVASGLAAIAFAAVGVASPFYADDRSLAERLEFSGAFILGAGAWWLASKACSALAREVRDKKLIERQDG